MFAFASGFEKEKHMNLEYIVAAIVALGLLAYLLYALLEPEKF